MMNLFPVTKKPSVLAPPQDFVSMNLFPMHAVFGSYVPKEEISKIADSRYGSLFLYQYCLKYKFNPLHNTIHLASSALKYKFRFLYPEKITVKFLP